MWCMLSLACCCMLHDCVCCVVHVEPCMLHDYFSLWGFAPCHILSKLHVFSLYSLLQFRSLSLPGSLLSLGVWGTTSLSGGLLHAIFCLNCMFFLYIHYFSLGLSLSLGLCSLWGSWGLLSTSLGGLGVSALSGGLGDFSLPLWGSGGLCSL